MNRRHSLPARLALSVFAWLAFNSFVAAAPPPALIHYEGRLTGVGGAPITSTTNAWFSIYKGSDANTANGGTLLYREKATLIPDTSGVFEYQIGSGTVESGSINPNDFNTSDPIYLQMAVGAVSTVVLPRTRFTSVGYAFYASGAAATGTPALTSLTDVTGGNIVVGDLLKISGSGLATASVLVNGKTARIKSQSASEIQFLVPEGTPMGLNDVSVVESSTGVQSSTVFHINVHRLIVWLSPSSNEEIFIVDAASHSIVASIDPGDSFGTSTFPIQMGFANESGLVIVPSMASSKVYAIDLTASTPKLVQTIQPSSVSPARAVAVSPDDKVAVVAGSTNLRVLNVKESAPPYASPLSDASKNLPDIPTGFTPRCSAFIGDSMFIAGGTGTSNNELRAWRREAGTTNFENRDFNDDTNTLLVKRLSLAAGATSMRITPDQTRALITLNGGTSNQNNVLLAPEGFSSVTGSGAGGANTSPLVPVPGAPIAFSVDAAGDLLYGKNIEAGGMTIAGQMEGPDDAEDFQMVDVEPVDGSLVVIGTNDGHLFFYRRTGFALDPLSTQPSIGTGQDTYGLAFQP